MKTYIGIDPGVTGAIAAIDVEHDTFTISTLVKMPSEIKKLSEAINSCYSKVLPTIILEQVHASPKMGVSGAFTFGRGFGRLEGVISTLGLTPVLVTPQRWQQALNCRTGGDKEISYRRCLEFFPGFKINKYAADALLLAYYGYWSDLK